MIVFFIFYLGSLKEVAEVAIVPMDILNLDSLYLLSKEAEVLFLIVIGFSRAGDVEKGKNSFLLYYLSIYLGGNMPGCAVLDINSYAYSYLLTTLVCNSLSIFWAYFVSDV